MSLSIKVNDLTLSHKGDTEGSVTATLPDVCKTDANVPVPFANIAYAIDLAGGTTTIFVDGGHMAAHRASVLAKSTGDEPGKLGGIKSGVHKGEASWLSYSMDVFFEGQNACRLTDKMLMNGGNTLSMGGYLTRFLEAWRRLAERGDIRCQILWDMIDMILNGHKGAGTGLPDMKGVKQRWFEQAMGAIGPGQNGWQTHEDQYLSIRNQLKDYLDAYDQFCGGGPPPPAGAWQWATRPAPTAADYAAYHYQAQPVNAGAVVVTVVLGIVTIGLLLFPFDGPVGEGVAGTATAGSAAMIAPPPPVIPPPPDVEVDPYGPEDTEPEYDPWTDDPPANATPLPYDPFGPYIPQ